MRAVCCLPRCCVCVCVCVHQCSSCVVFVVCVGICVCASLCSCVVCVGICVCASLCSCVVRVGTCVCAFLCSCVMCVGIYVCTSLCSCVVRVGICVCACSCVVRRYLCVRVCVRLFTGDPGVLLKLGGNLTLTLPTCPRRMIWRRCGRHPPLPTSPGYSVRAARIATIIAGWQVKAPTLLVMGAKDRRVPPSQGLEFFHALRARGVQTRCGARLWRRAHDPACSMLWYADAMHAIDTPLYEGDCWVNVALWMKEHLRAPA